MFVFWLVYYLTKVCCFCSADQQIVRHVFKPDLQSELLLSSNSLNVFCTPAPTLPFWASNCFKDLEISMFPNETGSDGPSDSFEIYEKVAWSYFSVDSLPTCTSLKEHASNPPSSYFAPLLWTTRVHRVARLDSSVMKWRIPSSPPSCLAICYRSASNASRILYVVVKSTFNFRHLFLASLGVLLLIFASTLSRSIGFYYVTGIGTVIIGSLLILLILFVRLLPFRRAGAILQSLFVLLGGTFSVICFAMDYVRSSLVRIFISNVGLSVAYISLVALVSFLLFYWFHLPERLVGAYPRTSIIMKNALKLFGVTLLASSVYLPFSEQELFSSTFSYISRGIYGLSVDDNSVMVDVPQLSPFVCRISLIVCSFVIVNLLEFAMYAIPRIIFFTKYDTGNRFSYQRSSFDNCLPGSPWACSSPYQHDFYTPKTNFSRSDPRLNTPHFFNGSSLSVPRDMVAGGLFTIGHRQNTGKFNDDILTDDESE